MLGYYPAIGSSNYYTDFLTIPSSSIVAGANTIIFTSGNWYNKVQSGYNVVPMQFICTNNLNNGTELNLCSFTNGSQNWVDKIDVLNATSTIAIVTDKVKVNHTHIDNLQAPLHIKFVPNILPTKNQVYITVLFTAWK